MRPRYDPPAITLTPPLTLALALTPALPPTPTPALPLLTPTPNQAEAAANRAALQHGDLPRYTTTHLPGGGVTYTKVAAGAELAGEAVAAMAADSQPTLSCKSLSPSATDYWCVTACAGRNNCPRNICKCDEG